MIDPTVRRSSAADTESLRELERRARAALVDQRGGIRWLEEHPSREWSATVRERAVFVAVLDDVVLVGYLVLRVSGDVAHVEEVYVEPDAREVGFGDALLDAAREHAVESGARILEGEALPGDRAVKNLYERAGITARLIVVSTELTEDASDERG